MSKQDYWTGLPWLMNHNRRSTIKSLKCGTQKVWPVEQTFFFKLKPRGTNVYWSRPPSWIISSLTPTEQVTELSVSFNIPDGGRTVTLQNTPALQVTESVLSNVEHRVDFQNYPFVVWCTILEISLQSWWNQSAGVLFSGAEVARGKSRAVIGGPGPGISPGNFE